MKTFKLICKGVLLYVTTFVVMLWICGIDSIVEQGYFIPWTLAMTVLVYTCYNIRTNLRLVCPNCDSQLETYKSKNKNSDRIYHHIHHR